MAGILLLVLKIILIIIGIILGVAVLLLAMVLFVPIVYEATGSKDDTLYLEGRASWLFNIIRLKFYYHNDIHYEAKVFWKKIYSSDPSESKKRDKKKRNNTKDIQIELNKEAKNEAKKETDLQKEKINNIKVDETDIPSSGTIKEIPIIKKTKKAKVKKKRKVEKRESSLKNVFETIRNFFTEDTYKGVIKFVGKHSFKIIKSILPRKIRLHLEFGTNDPAVTGYILGLLSIFYAFTGNSMDIKPDFEKQLLKGEFNIKGKIFIFVLVYHGLRIILDKRVKKLIAEYNH